MLAVLVRRRVRDRPAAARVDPARGHVPAHHGDRRQRRAAGRGDGAHGHAPARGRAASRARRCARSARPRAAGSTEIHLDCAWRSPMARVLQQVQAQVEAARDRAARRDRTSRRADEPDGDARARLLAHLDDASRRPSCATSRSPAWRPSCRACPASSRVVVQGGQRLEARVALDPAALEARGLDANGVADAIRKAFDVGSVGLLDANGELYLGLADARARGRRRAPEPARAARRRRFGSAGALGTVSLERAPEFTRYARRRRRRGAREPAAQAEREHGRALGGGAPLAPRAPRHAPAPT